MAEKLAAPDATRYGIRTSLRRLSWRYPEWWVVAAAAAGWVGMALMSHQHAGHAGIVPDHGHVRCTLEVVVMVTAMMLPLAVANVRHVALSSFWRRRHRAIVAFLVGFLGLWMLIQAGIVLTWELLTPLVGWESVLIAGTVAAVSWELAPIKRRRLRRGHRTVSLSPRGWRADSDCLRYGVTTGLACVTTCWALMAASAALSHSLVAMVVLFGVQLNGRYQRRPSPLLAALAVLAACLLSLVMGLPLHHHGEVALRGVG
jgi:predicted metal-binding membrane protein